MSERERAARVTLGVVVARIEVHRRHRDRREARVFQEIDELQLDLLEIGQHELRRVLLVPIVVPPQPVDPGEEPAPEDDDRLRVVGRDAARRLRARGIGRMMIQHLAAGDADQIGAERFRLVLDGGGGEAHAVVPARRAGGR